MFNQSHNKQTINGDNQQAASASAAAEFRASMIKAITQSQMSASAGGNSFLAASRKQTNTSEAEASSSSQPVKEYVPVPINSKKRKLADISIADERISLMAG